MKIQTILALIVVLSVVACQQKAAQLQGQDTKTRTDKISKTEQEWKDELNEEEFYVLRKAGTERAFTGDLWDHKGDGIYTCRACQLPLFDSETKFKSGTGWPSYYQPLNDTCIETDTDYHLGYARSEVHCARCDGHMGHVFSDGPKPTGLRYCINSVSLDFVERAEAKP